MPNESNDTGPTALWPDSTLISAESVTLGWSALEGALSYEIDIDWLDRPSDAPVHQSSAALAARAVAQAMLPWGASST